MRIAFHAPLKPPSHPVPSGDRKMARQLVKGLSAAGHEVAVASELRARLADASPAALQALREAAEGERARIAAAWRRDGPPDLVFCYHPYYRSPDLVTLPLARDFSLPYVTAEASWSSRRDAEGWAAQQELAMDAVRHARVNFAFTPRDAAGLREVEGAGRIVELPPFIDADDDVPPAARPAGGPLRLAATAMMRPGNKTESYGFLARSLAMLGDLDWTLDIVGDGPLRDEVHAAFADFPAGRIRFHGEVAPDAVPAVLAACDLFVFPGWREAYGVSYLEAQRAGLPVVAFDNAGVPAVVKRGETAILVEAGDAAAHAAAIRALAADPRRLREMAKAARDFVIGERGLDSAISRIDAVLREVAGR
ncbi:MAG: glycosyltransferase family 4 protein [Flavobacteriaceae bacterium]